jgi:hypothetical protein
MMGGSTVEPSQGIREQPMSMDNSLTMPAPAAGLQERSLQIEGMT